MPEPFEATTIKNMTLKNRFVRSATWTGMADADGECTDRLAEYMARLAGGGVGLIITGHAYVASAGKASFRQLGIYRDELVPGLAKMTDAVHKEDGRIVLQLAHAGCQGDARVSGMEAVGPSSFSANDNSVCREMSQKEIAEVVKLFAAAADRAKNAGFDGVQLHAAHGYLISQFLSPYYNKRKDEYGGSIENRARILIDIYRAVRNTAGNDFPVIVKINSEDFLDGGFTAEEMVHVSVMLEKEGVDAVEMSGGTIQSPANLIAVRPGRINSEEKEAYYRNAAKLFKEKVRLPLMLVGGIRSFNVAEKLIQEGVADYISMSRPFIREPEIINRWKSGDRGPSECKSDNSCFRPAYRGKGLYCVTKAKEMKTEEL